MTLARRLRVLLGVALLAAIGGACVSDGEAADFVAGETGDWRAPQARCVPTISAANAPSPQDLCAARRASCPQVSIPDSLAADPVFPTGRSSSAPAGRLAWRAAARIADRAPPRA